MMNQYVQYGCGLNAPLTWLNFDASPTLRLQKIPLFGGHFMGRDYPTFPMNVRYGDIVKGLPLSAESCKAVYCSHVLEHLALRDFQTALKNTYSYLESEGIFRCVLPDLEQLARDYLNSNDTDASNIFMEQSSLGKKTRQTSLKGFIREWLGNSSHLWMWDFKAISVELVQVGFRKIRRAKFGDSKDMRFQNVEDMSRWENSLGIECVK